MTGNVTSLSVEFNFDVKLLDNLKIVVREVGSSFKGYPAEPQNRSLPME